MSDRDIYGDGHGFRPFQKNNDVPRPLYHCAKCGRLSTQLDSYTYIGAQTYCNTCAPKDDK